MIQGSIYVNNNCIKAEATLQEWLDFIKLLKTLKVDVVYSSPVEIIANGQIVCFSENPNKIN